MNTQRTSGGRVTEPLPKFELVARDGRSVATHSNAQYLTELAGRLWPDQQQDETRSGKGWDIEVCPKNSLAD